MGFCPFFFRRKTKIMLNQRSDKVELLRIAEAVATEKSIDKEIILSSMESAIQKAAKTKFGSENDIRAKIDRESGDISLHKVLTIVEKQENFNNEISLKNAKKMKNKEVELLPLLQKVDGFANDVKLLIEKLKQMDKDIKELKQDILEI